MLYAFTKEICTNSTCMGFLQVGNQLILDFSQLTFGEFTVYRDHLDVVEMILTKLVSWGGWS